MDLEIKNLLEHIEEIRSASSYCLETFHAVGAAIQYYNIYGTYIQFSFSPLLFPLDPLTMSHLQH